jgi:Relaxase/Mobilisation nuclease domain
MLVKHSKGRSFYKALNYVLGKPGAKWLDGNTAGRNPVALEQEFNQLESVRPGVQRRLYHCALSLPTGEQLDDATWRNVAQDYLEQMGFGGHQYVAVRHTDTPTHEHIHIIANRVGGDGTIAQDSWDDYRAQVVARDLEQTYGLQSTPNSWETRRNGLSQKQLAKTSSTGKPAIQRQLQATIDAVLPQCETFGDFMEALDNASIGLKVSYGYNDQPIGLSYSQAGITMSGSALGRGYSLEGIRQQLALAVETPVSLHSPQLVAQTRQVITQSLKSVTADRPPLPVVIERLEAAGIDTHICYQRLKGKSETARSISFSRDGISFPGEALGQSNHLNGLRSTGAIDYAPHRDDPWIKQWQQYKCGKRSRPAPASSLKNSQTFEKNVSPSLIQPLAPHQVYVFGSSLDGQHEIGTALYAFGETARKQHQIDREALIGKWAVWGQGSGAQSGTAGQSYALPVRAKWTSKRSLKPHILRESVEQFVAYAEAHPAQEFLVAPFCNRIMRAIWRDREVPRNVHLPREWQTTTRSTVAVEASLCRVVMTGDGADQFNQVHRAAGIAQAAQGVKTMFRAAQGYDRIQFISGLEPGAEHWGIVAALQLREQQQQQEIPAHPEIEVIVAMPQIPSKSSMSQTVQRILANVDRVEAQSLDAYLVQAAHDRLMLVQSDRQHSESQLQRQASEKGISPQYYPVPTADQTNTLHR